VTTPLTRTPLTRTALTRTLLAATAIAVLALGSACGGGDKGSDKGSGGSGSSSQSSGGGSTDSSGALDPCTLVSTDKISSIVGATATQQGGATSANRGRECHWSIPDGLVAIVTFHGKEFFLAGTLGPAVPGIGDEAQATPIGGTILFRKGDEVVSVQVLGSDQSRDQAIALAKACAAAI
jgi:Protein of unknown function (DUF3558)